MSNEEKKKNKRLKTRKGKRDDKYTLIYFGGWDLTNWEKNTLCHSYLMGKLSNASYREMRSEEKRK